MRFTGVEGVDQRLELVVIGVRRRLDADSNSSVVHGGESSNVLDERRAGIGGWGFAGYVGAGQVNLHAERVACGRLRDLDFIVAFPDGVRGAGNRDDEGL